MILREEKRMNVMKTNFLSIEQAQEKYFPNMTEKESGKESVLFHDILQEKTLKFSKHATGRLEERNIELSKAQLQRLNEGTARAGAKGINESLVIVDSLAFIVNVPNSTVITAMDQSETEENIFTNIDGAVII